MMKFADHKFTWEKPFTYTRMQWSFRGPKGGLHFHVSFLDDVEAGKRPNLYTNTACGLEFHHLVDPSGGKEAAHHAHCWLLKAPCWHDGTSLYAEETVWPHVKSMLPDHSTIFRYLERLYEEHFDEMEGG